MTFQPDKSRPGQQELSDKLVEVAAVLGISKEDLLTIAKHGVLKERDEDDGFSWWIGETCVLEWSLIQQRFVPVLEQMEI